MNKFINILTSKFADKSSNEPVAETEDDLLLYADDEAIDASDFILNDDGALFAHLEVVNNLGSVGYLYDTKASQNEDLGTSEPCLGMISTPDTLIDEINDSYVPKEPQPPIEPPVEPEPPIPPVEPPIDPPEPPIPPIDPPDDDNDVPDDDCDSPNNEHNNGNNGEHGNSHCVADDNSNHNTDNEHGNDGEHNNGGTNGPPPAPIMPDIPVVDPI